METQYRAWMHRAIALARRGWGDTHPNPVVGALIIEGDSVVAEGYHAKAGQLHAERAAFRDLGRKPKPGSIMVVTLEPCSTYGRTPPCVDAIIENEIETLIVGATDPNPEHRGKGLEILRERGVNVISGIEAETCEGLNLIFNHHIENAGESFFAAKVATTLDGKIATKKGQSQWITGPEARANVAGWRRYFPAILVGAGTILKDDPSLTSRIDGKDPWCPKRLVIDTKGELGNADGMQVFSDAFCKQTAVLTSVAFEAKASYLRQFRDLGGKVIAAPVLPGSTHVDWRALSRWCAAEGLYGVYIEPGAGLMKTLIDQGALQYIFQYIAPKIMADNDAYAAYSGMNAETMSDVLTLKDVKIETFGQDVLLRGSV
ncbi:MAG: bifunctional diaminohydroxyphosphoribosylaminopyrimidine deaminase/5-amino-6-(5-phosphoribosylamino)uracil reductase RibD [Verrucomicrobiota bacterium]